MRAYTIEETSGNRQLKGRTSQHFGICKWENGALCSHRLQSVGLPPKRLVE